MSEADNKTSDKNVANVEDDVKIIHKIISFYKDLDTLHGNDKCKEIQALENILAEREQLLKERDVANDSVIAHRFAVMQQQINEKDKRIQELETKLEFKEYGDLDNLQFEEYMNQFVPKQAIIDKIKELDIAILECEYDDDDVEEYKNDVEKEKKDIINKKSALEELLEEK